MDRLTTKDFVGMLRAVATAVKADKDRLCELDGAIGDGDHGVTMEIGWTAVTKALDALPPEADLTTVCNSAAKSFLTAVGASAGPLYATALMRGGAALKGRDAVDGEAMAAFLQAAADGIKDRGKAEPGEKTMLDAWVPAAAAAREAAGAGLGGVLRAAAEAARAGMEATKGMAAGKGRSSRLGERALGHVDPGAASTHLIILSMARFVTEAEDIAP